MIVKVDRNYLEINSIKDLKSAKKPNDSCNLSLIEPPDFQLNKFFYKQIGREYRWIDRLVWDDSKWTNYVENPKVKTYILRENVNLVGYFETIIDPKYIYMLCEISRKTVRIHLITSIREMDLIF